MSLIFFRTKVKTVTFLLPVDDIYTNRPVLTKHQDGPKVTELDSITETDSWSKHVKWASKPSSSFRSVCVGLSMSESAGRFCHTWTNRRSTLVTGVVFTGNPGPVNRDVTRGPLQRGSGVWTPLRTRWCGFGERLTPAGDDPFMDSRGQWLRPGEQHRTRLFSPCDSRGVMWAF